MNVTFLVVKDILNGGGIEHYTREIGQRLVKRGHRVTVYSTRGDHHCPEVVDDMKIVWLPRFKPDYAVKLGGAGVAALKELNQSCDLLHLHSVAAGAMSWLLRLTRTPCLVQMHGIEWQRSRWSKLGQAVLRGLERASFRYADAFTAVSKTQCDYYSAQFGVPVAFIPTAAQLKERSRPDLVLREAYRPGKYVFSATRLVPEKGIHYLIEAFRAMRTDLHLVIAGSGPESYVQKLRELAGDDPRIHFIGYVKGRLLNELFSNAWLYVQPSEIEGLAIALLEAMSFGLPCLVSNIPENQEAVADAGISFTSKDPHDLRLKLEWATQHSDHLRELGSNARTRVATMYSWDSVTDSIEELYHEVIARYHEKLRFGVERSNPVRPSPR